MSTLAAEPCTVCGAARPSVLGRCARLHFVQCLACGVARVDPLPTDATLTTAYDGFYAGRLVQQEFERYAALATASLRHQFAELRALGADLGPSSHFLDVGFGGGHYLKAASDLGMRVAGVELDRAAWAEAKRQGFADVYNCSLPDAPIAASSVDLVKAMHVLEHVRDPRGVVRAMWRVLKAGGWAVIDVPNQASSMARFKISIRKVGLERSDYGYLQPPAHLYAFTPTALSGLLGLERFEVRRLVLTSPLDQRYFPTTPGYYDSLRGWVTKTLYRLLGAGSYMSVYARKCP